MNSTRQAGRTDYVDVIFSISSDANHGEGAIEH